MSLIPNDWILTYNGFTFDPEYTHSAGLEVLPVLDRTGRTNMYNKYTFQFRTWVLGFPTDVKIIDLLRRLNKPGQEFVYRGRLFGDFSINTAGGRADVMFGPLPKAIVLDFSGRKQAVLVQWGVEVHIPDCVNAKYQFVGLELAYRVEHKPRQNGRVDRTTSGELRIANNRKTPSGRELLDSPDEYRSRVAAPLATGFHRTWSPWVVNEARTTLSFGWTDSEFDDHNYPPGIAWCEFSQKTHSHEKGLVQFITTLSGEYRMAAGYPYTTAEKAFAMKVSERTAAARAAGATIIPMSFGAEENTIYHDPVATFNLSLLVVNVTLKDCLKKTGMWTPSSDSWGAWQRSVQSSVLNPYGYSNIRFRPGDDAIVDACDWDAEAATGGSRLNAALRDVLPQYPNASQSWIHYVNNIHVESDSGIQTYQTLNVVPEPPISGTLTGGGGIPPDAGPVNDGGAAFAEGIVARLNALRFGGPPTSPVPARPAGTLESNIVGGNNDFKAVAPVSGDTNSLRAAASTCYVIMYGSALRCGFPIPPPVLEDVEGVTPVEDNRLDRGEGFFSGAVANAALTIFGARWRLRYLLPKIPNRPITPPQNPTL